MHFFLQMVAYHRQQNCIKTRPHCCADNKNEVYSQMYVKYHDHFRQVTSHKVGNQSRCVGEDDARNSDKNVQMKSLVRNYCQENNHIPQDSNGSQNESCDCKTINGTFKAWPELSFVKTLASISVFSQKILLNFIFPIERYCWIWSVIGISSGGISKVYGYRGSFICSCR